MHQASFLARLETKLMEQLRSQRIAYLLGAGASYLGGAGYPLAAALWDDIKASISDPAKAQIQAKLDAGAAGLEAALDLLDAGLPQEGPHRHLVTDAIAEAFQARKPPLESHISFLVQLAKRGEPGLKVFSLNYDPLVERAAESCRVRLCDGFCGGERGFFVPALFEE